MKNQLVTLFALLSLLTSTLGQTNKLDIGVVGGPSLISLRGNDVFINNKHKTLSFGKSVGISFQYNFSKRFSILTNVAFEKKGNAAKIDITNNYGDIIGEGKLYENFNYITAPLLARYYFGKKIHFFANAGPYVGYLLKETEVFQNNTDIPDYTKDQTSSFYRLDLGITSGVGVSQQINNFILSFEIKNNLGIYNISNPPYTQIYDLGNLFTNSTNALFGVAYRLVNKE